METEPYHPLYADPRYTSAAALLEWMRDAAENQYERAANSGWQNAEQLRREWIVFDFALAIIVPGYVASDEAIREARSTLGVIG